MKPVDQTQFGWPHGNCFMACVASIMEVGLDDLPDLYEPTKDDKAHWWNVFMDAIRGYGWSATGGTTTQTQTRQPDTV